MKVLVTGANGFIGSNLCEKLIEKGFEVRALILPGSPEWYLEGIEVEKVYGDVCQPETLEKAVEGIEVIFHLAGIARDWGRWQDFIRVNAWGTENIARAGAKAGVKRILFTSSVAVHHYRDIFDGTEELERDCGRFAYGKSKIFAEDKLRAVSEESGIEYVIIRPAVFPFGPRDTTSFYRMAQAIERGIFGYVNSGRSKITVSYVENLCEGMVLAGTLEQAKNQVFLISDQAIAWQELVEKFARELGVPPPRLNTPFPIALLVAGMMELVWKLFFLSGEPPLTRYRVRVASKNLIFSSQKIERMLGWKPRIGLEEGIKKTVKWYQKAKRAELKI